MKSISSISYKYMKQHKTRTILNIFSIVISVAMIAILGSLTMGIRDLILFDAQIGEGNNQAIIIDTEYNKYERLKLNVDVEDVVLAKLKAHVNGIYEPDKDQVVSLGENSDSRIFAMTTGVDKISPDLLSDGRYPEKSDEIAIERSILKKMETEPKVGSEISLLLVGEADYIAKYKLVGIMEKAGGNYASPVSGFIVGMSPVDTSGTFNAYLFTKKAASTYPEIMEITRKVGLLPEQVNLGSMYNDNFGVNRINLIVAGVGIVFILIVAVSTFSGIFTVFNISYSQRLKQFGLMRAVGATEKQINDINKRELLILSIIGIPIGIIIGQLTVHVLFNWISGGIFQIFGYKYFKLKFYPELMVFIAIFSFATIYLSIYSATLRKKNLSPIEAIRQSDFAGVKVKKKRYLITKWLLGMEGYIARRNIDRSKGKFILSSLSIGITIAIFVTTVFTTQVVSSINYVEADTRYDYEVSYRSVDKDNFGDEEVNRIKNIDGIKDVTPYYNIAISVDAHISDFRDYLRERLYSSNVANTDKNLYVLYGSKFLIMKKEDIIKNYDVEENVLDEVINNKAVFTFIEYENYIETADMIEGNTIGLGIRSGVYINVPIGYYPIKSYGTRSNLPPGITVLMPEEVVSTYLSPEILQDYNINLGINVISENTRSELENYLTEKDGYNVRYNLSERIKRQTQTRIIRNYLLIFSGLMALSSGINIINSISSNMLTRKKELSLLKAIGMTNKAFKRMMNIETIYYSISGSILGFLLSALGILSVDYILVWRTAPTFTSQLIGYPIISYIVIVIITVFLVYHSSVIAMKKVMGDDLVANLRNE